MYAKIIEKIKAQNYSRTELLALKENAEKKIKAGDKNAQEVLELINSTAVPKLESKYVFMGFCPGADYENRQDEGWIEKGICNFEYIQSKSQLKKFTNICAGDTIILKKRQEFGRTMRLYAHGVVTKVGSRNSDGVPYCVVKWSKQEEILEMPLLGCNSTVDVKSLEIVEKSFHSDFWKWLGSEKPTASYN